MQKRRSYLSKALPTYNFASMILVWYLNSMVTVTGVVDSGIIFFYFVLGAVTYLISMFFTV
mgnify:FL=1